MLMMDQIYTISKDGALFQWEYMQKPGLENEEDEVEEENMHWRIAQRHYFMQSNAYVTCAAYHAPSNLLVTGFSHGIFTIHELPEFTEIQTLRFAQSLRTCNSHSLTEAASPNQTSTLLV
jgi:periodic tryptophan protein 2